MDNEQVLLGGGLLATIVTLAKLVLPYLSQKLGVGSAETKLLMSIKANQDKMIESQRTAAELERLNAVERRAHYVLTVKCEERLERLERVRHANPD